MYNLTVGVAHTFYVGDGQWLVHNCETKNLFELPKNAKLFTGESGLSEVFKRLERFNGIDENLASKRLHEIKAAHGIGAAENLVFDATGNVYHPKTGDWLGSMTAGGAKTKFK